MALNLKAREDKGHDIIKKNGRNRQSSPPPPPCISYGFEREDFRNKITAIFDWVPSLQPSSILCLNWPTLGKFKYRK